MKFRPMLAAALMFVLGGCATYDYTGGGPGGYYRGTPSVQYRYPPGYYDGAYGYPYGGSYGLYNYPVYPAYRGGGGYRRPPHGRPPPRAGNGHGQRPPPSNGPRPDRPRPPQQGPRPSRPEGRTPSSPWRNLNQLKGRQER